MAHGGGGMHGVGNEDQINLSKEEQKAAIQQQGLDTALQGIGLLKGLFEKNKGFQKALTVSVNRPQAVLPRLA